MIGHHVIHALQGAMNNPALAASYITRRLKMPYWFRVFLGAALPPYFNVSKMRSLYVVTYGRSGSTLLTGYLSKLPGCDLKGENYLFPLPMADADERLLAATKLKYGNRHSPESPWYGSHEFSIWRWRRDVRRAILNQLYPTRPIPKTIGFKEIRWWYRMTEKDYEAKLDWMRSIRPPGAIVFLTRDLDKTMAGAWWAEMSAEDRAEARKNLERFEGWVRSYAAKHPDHSVHVTYEDFTSSSEPAQRICAMLGLRFNDKQYRDALAGKYSYPSKKEG